MLKAHYHCCPASCQCFNPQGNQTLKKTQKNAPFFLFHLSSACWGQEGANQMYRKCLCKNRSLSVLHWAWRLAFRTYCQHREVMKKLQIVDRDATLEVSWNLTISRKSHLSSHNHTMWLLSRLNVFVFLFFFILVWLKLCRNEQRSWSWMGIQ